MILKLKNTNFINIKDPVSMKYIDINRIEVSNKLPFNKQDFQHSIAYKDPKK